MAPIWNSCGRSPSPLGLLALAIIAHAAMHTPSIKPYVERAPVPPKRYTVCGIAGRELLGGRRRADALEPLPGRKQVRMR